MSVTIADYHAQRKYMPPFAAGDPALLLDVDFRAGQAAVEALLATHNILPVGSAGAVWDPVRGWNPNGLRGYARANWVPAGHASRAAAFAGQEFTVAVEVERAALSSTWLDDGAVFIDSGVGPSAPAWSGSAVVPANHLYGDYTAAAKFGNVFRCNPVAGNNQISVYYQCTNNSGNPAGRCVMNQHDGTGPYGLTVRARPTVPSAAGLDPDYAQIVYACKGRNLRIYVDGHLRLRRRRAVDFWTEDLFYLMAIGCQSAAGANPLRGYIRRFQVANRAAYNDVWSGPRVAFGPGDSFMQRGGGHATPALTVAGVHAVQNALNQVGLDSNVNQNTNTFIGGHWRPWIHELACCAANEGLAFRFYCAGDAGHSWALTGSSTALPQIRSAFIDALVDYDAEIGVGLASINCVNGGNTATNYLAEVQALLTSYISRCYNMRRYLFVECFPGFKGSSVHAGATYIAEYHRQRALQAQLDGFTVTNAAGHDVVIEFVPVYDALGGDNYSREYAEGGSVYAPLWDARYGQAKTMNDLHPGQQGMDMMVEILYPHLRDAILEIAAESSLYQ